MNDFKLKNERTGRVFYINKPVAMIGRDTECDVVLALGYPSRHHAKISICDDELILEDLGSTNGTFLNDEKIAVPTTLNFGDIIKFGSEIYSVIGVGEHDSKRGSGKLSLGGKKHSDKIDLDETIIMR